MFSGQPVPRWDTWTEKSAVRRPIFPLKRVDQERDLSPLLKRLRLDAPCRPCICGECKSSYSRRCLSGHYMGVYHPGHQYPFYSDDHLHNVEPSSSSRDTGLFLSHPQEDPESYTSIRRPRIESTISTSSANSSPHADELVGGASSQRNGNSWQWQNGVTSGPTIGANGQDSTWKNGDTGSTSTGFPDAHDGYRKSRGALGSSMDVFNDYDALRGRTVNQSIVTDTLPHDVQCGSAMECSGMDTSGMDIVGESSMDTAMEATSQNDDRHGAQVSASAAIEERREILRTRFQEEMRKYRQEVCRRSSGTPIRPCG